MKLDAGPGGIASQARVEFTVKFAHGPKGRRHVREAPVEVTPRKGVDSAPEPAVVVPMGRVPKITRLLVLGHHFERLVRAGAVKDYAEIARLTGLTRARITQIVNLTLLSPEIQDAVLTLPPGSRMTERSLRPLISHAHWRVQQRRWESLAGGLADRSPGQSRSVLTAGG